MASETKATRILKRLEKDYQGYVVSYNEEYHDYDVHPYDERWDIHYSSASESEAAAWCRKANLEDRCEVLREAVIELLDEVKDPEVLIKTLKLLAK